MKRGTLILLLILSILPGVLSETQDSGIIASHASTISQDVLIPSHNTTILSEKPSLNPWNETVVISDTWQQIIGTFFGFNIKGISTEISVREIIVLLSLFIMFFVILLDILQSIPLFEAKVAGISTKGLVALIITILVSISGSLIGLKDVFINAIIFLMDKLTLGWISSSNASHPVFSFIIGFAVLTIFMIIWQFFSWFNPLIKKYSTISRAEAKGRLLNRTVQKSDYNLSMPA